jgi:methylated-DNA-[protein]-cysteine S-methyltransferase
MAATAFSFFDTAIGVCGIAWNERGVNVLQLPEASAALCRARMRGRHPQARETSVPPAPIGRAIDAIQRLLPGEKVDLRFIELDMSAQPAFHRRVYEAAREIPPGKVETYGELAVRLGEPGEARAVGQALGRNPYAVIVPCHRVLATGGRLGGFSAPGGVATKERLLAIERPTSVTAPLF